MEPTLNLRGGGTGDDEEEDDAASNMSPEQKKARSRRPDTADLPISSPSLGASSPQHDNVATLTGLLSPVHGSGLFQAGSAAAAPKDDVTSDDSFHAESDEDYSPDKDDLKGTVTAMANLSSPSIDKASVAPKKKKPPSKVKSTTTDEATQDMVNFRDISAADLGIDLGARTKYKHYQLNQHSTEYGNTDPTFENPFLSKLYKALKEFMKTMESRNYTDRKGKPLLWNMPSLPVGLSENEKVVILFINYLTSEEGNALLKNAKNSYTAEHSDHTIIPNTIEMARRALGDASFYRCLLADASPVAYPYESSLEEHCTEEVAEEIMNEWRMVLAIMVEGEDVTLGLGAGTAEKAFAKTFGKTIENILESHPAKFISAAEAGEAYASPPHPCSLYDVKKLSNMEAKLRKAEIFYTALRRVFDPDAPRVEFFDEYWDENSSIFDLCQRAFLDGSSRGGTETWKRTKAALERRGKSLPTEEGDDKLLKGWDSFVADRKEYVDMVRIRNKLASHFIISGGLIGNGRSEVVNHAEFEDFKYRSGLVDDEEALAAVQGVADGFGSTFQNHIAGLKAYKQKYPGDIVHVDGHFILVVDQNKEGGRKYRGLWQWLTAMIGYSDKYHQQAFQYGLKVRDYPESAQYKALEQLNVTFDPDLYAKAMEQRLKDEVNSKTSNATNRKSFMSYLEI
eukprot:scaffold4486_cov70-Skeletonema_marinoi.AAC.1